MSEELKEGVTEVAEAPVTPPVTEELQSPVVSEDVNTQEKDYAYLYENAKRALKETREKERSERDARIALEQQIAQNSQAPVQQDDDEAVQRFYANEALTQLVAKAQYDPFVRDNFKDLEEDVIANPLQGVETAIMRHESKLLRTILKSSDIEKPQKMASQAPTATPEETPETRTLDPNLPDLEARLAEKLG